MQSPNDARIWIEGLPNPSVVIIDEFDRVGSREARALMADTIKLFSDRNVKATLVIVGVAESIADLIGEHQSVSRNIAQIPVEPMTVSELAEIVQRGYRHSGFTFEKGLDERTAVLSQGYPHFTHLLALWAGRIANERSSNSVSFEDLSRAIPAALENSASGLQHEYDLAVDSNQPENLFEHVLLACALADKDARGRFGLGSLRDPLRSILMPLGRSAIRPVAYQGHLAKFCEFRRGPVLKRTGSPRNYHWQFVNPQLVPFIELKGISEGKVPGPGAALPTFPTPDAPPPA